MGKRSCFICRPCIVAQIFLQGLWLNMPSDTYVLNDPNESFVKMRTSRDSTGCPPSWKRFESKCYRAFKPPTNKPMSWQDANNSCALYGSSLVSIHSQQQQDFLTKYVSETQSNFWIGLHYEKTLDAFGWTDGSNVDFRNWGKQQPASETGEEHCVLMRYATAPKPRGKWHDSKCNIRRPYICHNPKVDGGWGDWGDWSQCTATCGQGGVRHRLRRCNNPAPSGGGKPCAGCHKQRESCAGQRECPAVTFP